MENETLLKQVAIDPTGHLPLFSYSARCPFTNASEQLRLVTLFPAEYAAPLRCTLQAWAVTELPPYQALSYAWGTDQKTHSILVPEVGDIEITESLDTCLRYLRHEKNALTLWIDQICINQNDTAEKGQQVLLMKDVYVRAEKILVWLGQAANGSDELIDLLLKIGQEAKDWGMDYYKSKKEHLEELRDIIARVDMTNLKTIEFAAMCDRVQEVYYPHVAAHWRFYQRPWFRRIWVVQEFSLASEAVFVCGHKRANPELLAEGAGMCSLAINSGGSAVKAYVWGWIQSGHIEKLRDKEPLTKLVNCRKKCQWQIQGVRKGWTMLDHLKFFFSTDNPQDAKDPRDRIFGLLALPCDRDELRIVPDYRPETTPEQVYTNVAKAILKRGQLELLNLCGGKSQSSGNASSLPSWVPDWREKLLPSFCNIKHPEHEKPYFSAGGSPGAYGILAEDLYGADMKILGVEGYVIDEIESTGRDWHGEPPQREVYRDTQLDPKACESKFYQDSADAIAEQHSEMLAFLDSVRQLCEEAIDKHKMAGTLTPDIETALNEAKWRVPIGDLADEMPEGRTGRATSEYARAYEAYVTRSERQICRDYQEYLTKWLPIQDKIQTKEFRSRAGRYTGNLEEMKNMRPFLTNRGYVGMGPLATKHGDIAVVVVGAHTPYVLRRLDSALCRRFVLLGEAYCHMAMDGEVLQTGKKEQFFLA